MPHADTQAMSAHLAEIAKTVASGAHALLILDGAGWRGSAELEVPDNITLLKLPPYELNPMENVWAYLRANKLAISVFDNYEQIVDRCCEAWNFFANDKTAITSITTRPKRSTTSRWYYPWFELGLMRATRMACGDLPAEREFFAMLATMTLAEVSGDVLILSNPDGAEMVFQILAE